VTRRAELLRIASAVESASSAADPGTLRKPCWRGWPPGAEVLHVDSDYNLIAEVTGQSMRRLLDPGHA
jgi:hypothetical protein